MRTANHAKKSFTAVVAGALSLSLLGLAVGTAPASASDSEGALLPPITAPETLDTFTGQSIQVRADADGNPDSNLADFRWNVTQINAESLNDINASVPLPMANTPLLRSLTGTGSEPQKVDDGVLYDFNNIDGVDNARTLNLVPADQQIGADVKAEFTLDGETVQAQDIVGKGGVVTATYTVTNNTRKSTPVTYKTIGGKVETKTIDTDQPMVAIALQLIPQSWGQFNAGSGVAGADGRGNYQTQWIGLPFAPLSKTGKATFGWTAVIPDGEGFIPNMSVNVAPIYIPDSGKTPQPKEPGAGGEVPGASTIAGGVGVAAAGGAELVKGIGGLANTIGGGIQTIGNELPGAVSDTKKAVKRLASVLGIGSGGSGLPSLPQVISSLERTSTELGLAIRKLRLTGNNSDAVKKLQAELNTAAKGVGLLDTYVNAANSYAGASSCDQGPLTPGGATCLINQGIVEGGFDTADSSLKAIQKALKNTAKALPNTVGDLEADVLEEVQDAIDGIVDRLEGLQTFLTVKLLPAINGVTDSIGEVFGAIDDGIAQIKQGVPGDISTIGSGAAELGSGIGDIGVGARELISTLMSLAFTAKKDLKKVAGTVNTLKADLAGLIMRAHDSPLPYGGGFYTAYQPKGAPEVDLNEVSQAILQAGSGEVPEQYSAYVQPTNALFGAYQFILDPANANKPDTLPRILIGLVALLIAGIALPLITRRRAKAS